MTRAPERVSAVRPAAPAMLEGIVMRCLEKRAADRWQNAREILPHLSARLTPTGGTQPVPIMPTISSGTQAALARSHSVRVGVLFPLAAVGILGITRFLVQGLGLPDWVFAAAIMLLAIGLPIVLFTSRHERQRAVARATGLHQPTPTGLVRHLTWRRSVLGGVAAFALLGVAAAGYMVMRVLGIGLGETYDRSGQPDSAIAHFERLLAIRQLGPGPYMKPVMLRRLGQLYEKQGNRDRALEYNGKFVDLWKDADPSVQPLVTETQFHRPFASQILAGWQSNRETAGIAEYRRSI